MIMLFTCFAVPVFRCKGLIKLRRRLTFRNKCKSAAARIEMPRYAHVEIAAVSAYSANAMGYTPMCGGGVSLAYADYTPQRTDTLN